MSTEIENGNKAIATFMDLKNLSEGLGGFFDIPDYHSSWNELMPVIDDIYYSRRFPTGAQTSELSSRPHKLYKEIEKSLLHLSIEQTWQAVIQFIIWHNQQKSKTK